MRQDAQMWMQMFGQNPMVEPQMVLEKALGLMGVENPKGWMKPPEQQVPAGVLDMLAQVIQQQGGDPSMIAEAIEAFQQQQPGGQGQQQAQLPQEVQ
jgi:hypothetical protein